MRLAVRRPFLRVVVFVAIFAAGLGVGAGYMAYGATPGNTYYACITAKGDIYRVRVNQSFTCIGSDVKINWNQQGPPGPQGPVGPRGPQGIQGLQGVPGQDAADLPLICPGCVIEDVSGLLSGKNLVDAYLELAILDNTSFDDSDLTNADLLSVNAQHASFERANLTNVTLNSADLEDSSLEDATIEGLFVGSANFSNATLVGAKGTPATIASVTWDNTVCPDGTNSDDDGDTCAGHFLPLP